MKEACTTVYGGFPGFPLPLFHEDMLRENDPPEADRGFGRRLASGEGCPPMTKIEIPNPKSEEGAGRSPAGSLRVSLNSLLPP